MNRDESIVYLATEHNRKSVIGLREIIEDGWSVQLAIVYVVPSARGKEPSLTTRLNASIKKFAKRCLQMPQEPTRKIALETVESICRNFNIRYLPTSDRTLARHHSDIDDLQPAVILANGWRYRVSPEVISMARLIALNCHSSYLPEYRGGNVTYAPLINEERQSGVTVHELIDRFDAGAILAQERVAIDSGETPDSLQRKRADITGRVLVRALDVAGHPELYKLNPPSPFYFRCSEAEFRRYKRLNALRKLVGLPIRKFEPQERYDI